MKQEKLTALLNALSDEVKVPWETNCAGEIFVAGESEHGALRIGHFQGDAALSAYVVAMHNATLVGQV
ncbi:MAG: hypothetical protein ACNJA3_27980 (plasmid) [Pseudomonas rhizophila]|uniref:hypothetical protein n=1 Tax=Pseudomonas rhizophila TaxID=2045200 RepID=UPI003F6D2AAE